MRGEFLAAAGGVLLALGGTLAAQEQSLDEVDTLNEALAQTYNTNPTIMAERARLRATDEEVVLAKAEGRPRASVFADFSQDALGRNIPGTGDRDLAADAEVSVPLFAGGRIRNAIRAADTRVLAGRADLRATEGDTFTAAVAAYMDVLRDRAIVALNDNQVRVLETNLMASQARYDAGDLTLTDVAQSRARLALARSNLGNAVSRMEASEENYRRVVGVVPGELQPPPPLPELPASPDRAVDVALANNADLASVTAQARAAAFDVKVARGARLPTISATIGTRYFNGLGSDYGGTVPISPNSTIATDVGISLSLPLYQGGGASARVRQAQAIRSQVIEQSAAIERSVLANARAAFASLRAAEQAIEANSVAVAANDLALEGTRAEQTAGTRNTLDVLNAEQELLNSKVALVTARRDAYVAGFQLLNIMGLAEAKDLNLDGRVLYDPTSNYERYSDSWSDWNDGPDTHARPTTRPTNAENSSSIRE